MNHKFDKGLLLRIKNSYNSTRTKINCLISKLAKDLKRHFSTEVKQMANKNKTRGSTPLITKEV